MSSAVNLKYHVTVSALAMFLIAFSYFFLDARVALFVYRLIKGSDLLTSATSDIPDVLLHLVIIGTLLCWTCYFFLAHLGIQNRHTRFLRACGIILPIAFIAKSGHQYAFGRSDVHAWVISNRLPRFFWFRMAEGYGCFPSGHMTVFTALVVTLSSYYPRYRTIYHALLILLGLALIASDYHFPSDVMAGAFLGALVALIIRDDKSADKALEVVR
jgi:membrane-associated phospholipid phosphatase